MERLHKIIGLFMALLTLLSTGLGVYYTYFDEPPVNNALLSVENLDDQHEFDVDKDVEFSFFLYNKGGESAFVDYVQLQGAEIEPQSDFVVGSGESLEIDVVLEAPGEEFEVIKTLEVWFDEDDYIQNEINVRWGP